MNNNSQFLPQPVCGNNIVEAGEACGGSDLNEDTCTSLPEFASGTSFVAQPKQPFL